MKILQISSFVPTPPTNGGKHSVFGITKYLHKRGHEIHFVCYRKHDNYDEAYSELSKISTPYILDVQTENSYLGAFLNFFSRVPYNASKYKNKKLYEFLKNFFKKNNVDIIHIDHLHMGWIVDYLRKWTDAPVVLREQNLELMIMKRFSEEQKNPILKWYSKLQYKKFIKFEPELCGRFDKCVMISETDEIRIKELNPKINVTSIPAGVESRLLEYNSTDIIPYSLVHIGHTDWFPNYDGLSWFVSKILPEIIKVYPQTTLYIYGGGKTSKFSVPSSVKQNVKIIGFVDNLWEEIIDKSLAIVPLRIGSGIRIKILELLAVGIPIVSTSIGKEGIDVVNDEHVLVADLEKEFINKILNFFNGIYDSESLIINGKKLISEKYTWDVIAEKIEKLYLSLIEKK